MGACFIHESLLQHTVPVQPQGLLHRQDTAVKVPTPLGLQAVDELMKTKMQAHIIGPVVQALALQLRGQLSRRQQPRAAAAEPCSYVPLLRMPVIKLQSGHYDMR